MVYPDTATHWARGYIHIATLLGIMSHDPRTGGFDPDRPVSNLDAQNAAVRTFGYMLFIPSIALGGYAYLKLRRR